jgi:transposase InsO family protein
MNPQITEDQLNLIKYYLTQNPTSPHWIQLSKQIREILVPFFEAMSSEDIVKALELPLELVQKWSEQKIEVDFIVKDVNECKGRMTHTRYTYYPVELKLKAIKLTQYIPVHHLSKIINVPRSTLDSWKNLGAGKDNIPVKENISPIESSPEIKKLKDMIKRHEGKTRRKYSKSEKDLVLILLDQFGPKLVNEQTRISYDSLRRFQRERAKGFPKVKISSKYAPVIEIMKKYPGMGPMQIRDYVHRHLGVSMGVNTVRKVMEDNGWIPCYTRKTIVDTDSRRYEAIRRNYLWHLDFKHFYINKCKTYILFIEDDYSRFIAGHALSDGENVNQVIESLAQAMNLHGKPETVMSDGGSAFYSWRGMSKLSKFFEDYGIDQKISRVPRVNGKVESLNQKIENELLNTMSFSSINSLEHEISQWVGLYNFRRVHQGLGNLQVPADRYYPGSVKWFKESNENSGEELFKKMMNNLMKELKDAS